MRKKEILKSREISNFMIVNDNDIQSVTFDCVANKKE